MDILLQESSMRMPPRICPRCYEARPFDESCETEACQEFRGSPIYWHDDLEGNLFIAQEQYAAKDKSFDWATIIRELEKELREFDAKMGPAAFTQ